MYTFYILKQKDLQESKLEEKLQIFNLDYLILFWPHDHSVLSQAKSSLRLEIRCFNFSLHHHYSERSERREATRAKRALTINACKYRGNSGELYSRQAIFGVNLP